MQKNLLRADSALPRIAMISTHGYVAAHPPLGAADTGGQVVYVLELARKVALLGYEVDIWTRQFEEQAALEHVSERVRIIRVPCGGKEFIPKEYLYQAIPEWCETSLRLIKKNHLKYRLINSHYWDAGLAGQTLSQALEAPHFHTPHSLGLWKKRQMEVDHPEEKDQFEKRYNFNQRMHYERLLYTSADMVIATTPEQEEFLMREYELSPANCRMIPPGYDDHRFFPVSESTRRGIRERLGFSGKVIFAVGRLARNKGYDLLIQAFEVLAKREPEAMLHLALGGSNLSAREQELLGELHALVDKLNLKERVRFSGFVPDEALADYYRAADLFVLSSRYEPFGMTAIEAMASGTPTIVTVHGGLWKGLTFGRNALFADPLDKEDLGIMMLKPFRFPRLRSRLARMGASRARSLFAWTGIAHQLIALVEDRISSDEGLLESEWDEPLKDVD
jgi:mannosylfructose-phosphate synthase